MTMARCCPGKSEFTIINEPALLKTEDDCLSNIVFDATSLKVSEKLALTFRPCNKCIQCNCVSYFVRVGAFATFYLCKLQ